ncbi:hypothetical protein Hanom_Chr16g01419561 [Helianthus anomalus]
MVDSIYNVGRSEVSNYQLNLQTAKPAKLNHESNNIRLEGMVMVLLGSMIRHVGATS